MKLKVKFGRRQLVWLAVAVLVVVALVVGRSSKDEQHKGLDAAAGRACSDFAAGVARAKTKPARLSLADKVMASSNRTENTLISKRAAAMGRSADDGNASWKASADALTSACRDAGWKSAT